VRRAPKSKFTYDARYMTISRRPPRRITFGLLLVLAAALPSFATAGERGVVAGAPGAELRANKSETAPIVATIQPGVPFSFAPDDTNEWAEVTLDAGTSGWLPLRLVRLWFDDGSLPRKDPTGISSEIDDAARARGLDYVKITRRAAHGDAQALRQFFSLAREADGAAAECLTTVPTAVYHLLGDAKFAGFLRGEPLAFQALVRGVVLWDARLPPTTVYLQRHFPETAKVLFPSELVGWPSPNGRYAIRKVFSDPFDMGASKIARAELIEKKTGQVLLDLTADDIGTGAQRDGSVLWSPDSKRFASLSIDLTQQPGNLLSTPRPAPLRKQTAVYQSRGDVWTRVALPLDVVPGRDRDTELEGAILGHDYVEPARWKSPNVLVLERHEYYEKKQPQVVDGLKFESIVGLSRWYWVTATIDADGKASLAWKRRAH
jgi:hypothetical protein